MARGKQMKALQQIIAEKEKEIERLTIEVGALKAALDRASGKVTGETPKAPRANVKQLVLTLLKEARHTGLNAGMAVEMARQRGDRLERGSVSSLLSRLKADGMLAHDGKLYRLKEFAQDEGNQADKPSASIHALRASGDAP